jgi:hypothetical protein
MNGRPIWAASAWAGFICVLLALSSVAHGYVAAGLVMLLGTAVLVGWALWLAHRHH